MRAQKRSGGPRLSVSALRMLMVLDPITPKSVEAAAIRAGLSERQGFLAASTLLEFERARLTDGGLIRAR